MPQKASVFCNFYIRVDREALVSERALDVGSVAFKAMSTKTFFQHRCFKTDVCLTFQRKICLPVAARLSIKLIITHFYECKMLLLFVL
jgi:hypothetical protein